jgi:hypothetical protein
MVYKSLDNPNKFWAILDTSGEKEPVDEMFGERCEFIGDFDERSPRMIEREFKRIRREHHVKEVDMKLEDAREITKKARDKKRDIKKNLAQNRGEALAKIRQAVHEGDDEAVLSWARSYKQAYDALNRYHETDDETLLKRW